MGAKPDQRRLLHVFSSFEVGGPQIRFCQIANWLGSDYHHTIISMDRNFECMSRLTAAASWEIHPVSAKKSRGINFGNLVRFRRLLNDLRPDVLATYGWGALEWGLVNRFLPIVPHLHFEDGFGPEENPMAQLRRRVYLRRIVFGANTRVVVPSRTLWDVATERWALPLNRLFLVPNGIDCERFDRPTDRSLLGQFGINPDGLVIGTVASLRPEKNLARLIAAFARVHRELPAVLVIVGDGVERLRLEQMTEAFGLRSRVHFLGMMEDPETIYSCFDIFAMSSDTEQMPISLLEALASGLPVVATDVGDIAAMVAPENSTYIRGCSDDKSLAKHLWCLATNPALRAELGMRNRARARTEFGLEKMVSTHKALFDLH